MFAPAFAPSVNSAFARDVAHGLTQTPKTLPPSWLYDELGSILFEAITVLPEYGLTRADDALLRSAAREIVAGAGHPGLILELGSGSGSKTRHLLMAGAEHASVDYQPIDISTSALETCRAALSTLDRVRIKVIEAGYLDGLDHALARRLPKTRVMVLFLGSTIGNFEPSEAQTFLQEVRARLRRGDTLLLGTDLVKPRNKVLKAYNDALGVTAAFNLNLLVRMNRELDAEFDLAGFAHEARYDEKQSRIEMHLRSRVAQTVRINALDLDIGFQCGETIWTESSHKFRKSDIARMAKETGWQIRNQWIDTSWGFAETLLECR